MFRILHFADLHLGTSFAASGLPTAVGTWRRVDLNATLERILTLARERQVDAVTIAGDLYEQEYALPDTTDWLKQQFAQLAPIQVFIAPGEHDPYTPDSLYTLTNWPQNVTIFPQGWLSAVELTSGIHLWGAAHPAARNRKRLDNFRVDRDGVNILLLHAVDVAQLQSGQPTTFVVDAATVHAAGFDFALLGHQHTGRLWPEETPCCVYPGSPEPLVLEESSGTHQVVVLTIEEGACKPELIPISQWRYLSLEVDLTGCKSIKAAAKRIRQSIGAIEDGNNERSICYVGLTGQPNFDLDVEALYDQVKTKAYVHYETRLPLAYDLEQLAQEPTSRGLLVQNFQTRLEKASSDQERRLVLNALNLALQALDGKKVQY